MDCPQIYVSSNQQSQLWNRIQNSRIFDATTSSNNHMTEASIFIGLLLSCDLRSSIFSQEIPIIKV